MPTIRSIKDVTKTLQAHFSHAKIPLSLPPEIRRILQAFAEEHVGRVSEEEASKANLELKAFWEKYVLGSPQKLGAFIGVLNELRSYMVEDASILDWWQLVVKPVIRGTTYGRPAQEDAREFLVSIMVYDAEDGDGSSRASTSGQLCSELLAIYIDRSRGLTQNDRFIAQDNLQVTQQVEDVLIAFGRKRPKDLFHSIDDLVQSAGSRLQALTLLGSFLRHQAPHLYLVVHTPLAEHLLKCLMNDTSTTILSVALTCLIMLLPHIPGSLGPYLPRLFLVYSRLLCWERFSPLSSEAEKSVVTDDRVAQDTDEPCVTDLGDVGIDPTWEKARPQEGMIEANTPELLTYFTYLYGLYPLNFMSYVRKPRRYLKNVDFAGADAFDLDQAVIRSRTEQFQQMHLLHPNFFNMTVEEELIDPKWPRMDPADVVGDCHSLCINSRPTLVSPGPPPSAKLPELPPMPMLSPTNVRHRGQLSPTVSHTSFRTGSSWRDTHSTGTSTPTAESDSPDVQPDDRVFPLEVRPNSRADATAVHNLPSLENVGSSQEKQDPPPQTNLAYLQREITLLRNDLNFERWHKAQYSQHISQIMRRNVKEATVEAETLNLINANRALKKQLDQARKAREATTKDSILVRKQASTLETTMVERFNKMRVEQETWQADADELRRLRDETKQYRELLVATEARELNKSHQLELAQRDLEEVQKLKPQLKHAQRRIHEYEYHAFEYESASRLKEIAERENKALQAALQRHEDDHERLKRAYSAKITELETQLGVSPPLARQSSDQSSFDSRTTSKQGAPEAQLKLAQLKKAHARLLENYTDLELEYQSALTELDSLRGRRVGHQNRLSFNGSARTFSDHGYDIISDYIAPSEATYTTSSHSDPTNRRFQPAVEGLSPAPSVSQASVHRTAGLTFESTGLRQSSIASDATEAPAAFNPSAPLGEDEGQSVFGDGGGGVMVPKPKIQPDSTVRVYGRGGAQNIKLKPKGSQKKSDSSSGETKKPSALKGLRKLV